MSPRSHRGRAKRRPRTGWRGAGWRGAGGVFPVKHRYAFPVDRFRVSPSLMKRSWSANDPGATPVATPSRVTNSRPAGPGGRHRGGLRQDLRLAELFPDSLESSDGNRHGVPEVSVLPTDPPDRPASDRNAGPRPTRARWCARSGVVVRDRGATRSGWRVTRARRRREGGDLLQRTGCRGLASRTGLGPCSSAGDGVQGFEPAGPNGLGILSTVRGEGNCRRWWTGRRWLRQ